MYVKRIYRLCKLIIDEGLDIIWDCSTRVDLFNKALAITMKKAGCRRIFFGFESGVQKTLDFLNKGLKLEDSEKAVKIAKDVGLDINGHFIIGVPGETKDMINETIAFAKKLNLLVSTFSVLVPYPGTRIYDIAEKNNLLLTQDWSKYTLFNPVMKIPGFTAHELRGVLIKAYLSCNFRFSKIKLIKKLIT